MESPRLKTEQHIIIMRNLIRVPSHLSDLVASCVAVQTLLNSGCGQVTDGASEEEIGSLRVTKWGCWCCKGLNHSYLDLLGVGVQIKLGNGEA